MFDSAQLSPPRPHPNGLLDLPQSDAAGSGASTPPLWPTTTPPDVYDSLSPASRTQAILRGQRELMELVRNLPESSYELSLRDLVDLPRPSIDGDRVTEGHGRRRGYGNGNMGKKQQQQQQEGMLLKMVFPVYTGAAAARGRRRRRRGAGKGMQAKEEPSGSEKEWWRKRDADSESGDSSYSSTTIGGSRKSSGSSSSRSSSANSNSNSNSIIPVRQEEKESGCWSFLRRKNVC